MNLRQKVSFSHDFIRTVFHSGDYAPIVKLLLICSRFTWEILQSILGWMVLLLCRVRWEYSVKRYSQGYSAWFFYIGRYRGVSAVSLGGTILVFGNEESIKSNDYLPNLVCKHEFGHTIQSRILGPLYLILIGIPSVLTSITAFHENMPWEKWADYLASDAKTN